MFRKSKIVKIMKKMEKNKRYQENLEEIEKLMKGSTIPNPSYDEDLLEIHRIYKCLNKYPEKIKKVIEDARETPKLSQEVSYEILKNKFGSVENYFDINEKLLRFCKIFGPTSKVFPYSPEKWEKILEELKNEYRDWLSERLNWLWDSIEEKYV